jgi:hypothetical protein
MDVEVNDYLDFIDSYLYQYTNDLTIKEILIGLDQIQNIDFNLEFPFGEKPLDNNIEFLAFCNIEHLMEFLSLLETAFLTGYFRLPLPSKLSDEIYWNLRSKKFKEYFLHTNANILVQNLFSRLRDKHGRVLEKNKNQFINFLRLTSRRNNDTDLNAFINSYLYAPNFFMKLNNLVISFSFQDKIENFYEVAREFFNGLTQFLYWINDLYELLEATIKDKLISGAFWLYHSKIYYSKGPKLKEICGVAKYIIGKFITGDSTTIFFKENECVLIYENAIKILSEIENKINKLDSIEYAIDYLSPVEITINNPKFVI